MSVDLPEDPRWPRASAWFADGTRRWQAGSQGLPDLALIGVPAHSTSISPTRADRTPQAVREALARYSTWVGSQAADLRDLWAVDLGDVESPDGVDGELRTTRAIEAFSGQLVVALGGDNSITLAVARACGADGLITLDAHHDLRDGMSNGSPVRRLVEAGLDGSRIVQIGINDFANSGDYAARARDWGITVVHRDEVEARGLTTVMGEALEIAGGGAHGRVHVDIDVDVCDRSVVPACPAAMPGGLSARELRLAARLSGADPRVVSVDFTEVDATADSADQRTVRLVALGVLEVAAGLLSRGRG
ncbi:MAG: arginase family protein [Candidatus Nanopelagicales bacterium]|nr:arginase family protein [Candidatus Nanopelagicales bacterium]